VGKCVLGTSKIKISSETPIPSLNEFDKCSGFNDDIRLKKLKFCHAYRVSHLLEWFEIWCGDWLIMSFLAIEKPMVVHTRNN